MTLPPDTRPFLWGAASGAVLLAIAGFGWGGWLTGGKAEAAAVERVNTAVVTALAPGCVERFQRAANAQASLAELKKADAWSQGDYIEKGGWATPAGAKPGDQTGAVARACAVLLAAG